MLYSGKTSYQGGGKMPYIERWHIDDDGAILGDLYSENRMPQGFFVIPNAIIENKDNGEKIVYDGRNKSKKYRLVGEEVPITQIVS